MKKHIAIVEDDAVTSLVLVELLLASGFAVSPFASAEDALTELRSSGFPDMVISDIRLPGMDGFQLLNEIRNLQGFSNKKIAVVGMSASGDCLSYAASAAGFELYVSKPFYPADLLAKINSILNRPDSGL